MIPSGGSIPGEIRAKACPRSPVASLVTARYMAKASRKTAPKTTSANQTTWCSWSQSLTCRVFALRRGSPCLRQNGQGSRTGS